jgi:UrcA family protein
MKNSIILVAVAAFITCSVTVAQADAFEPRSVLVRFADLDTTNTQGAATLFSRLNSAAKSVCRDLEPGGELTRVRVYAYCMHTALGNAIDTINRPVVTAYAAAHGVPTGDSSIRVAGNK